MGGQERLLEIAGQWKQKSYLRDEIVNEFPIKLNEYDQFFIPVGWSLTKNTPYYVMNESMPVLHFSKDTYIVTFVKKDDDWILRYISKGITNLQEEIDMYDIYTKQRIYSEVLLNYRNNLSYAIFNFQGELIRFGWEDNHSHHAEFSYKNGSISIL